MRMSDWSSDVCDSELRLQHKGRRRVRIKRSDHIEQEIVQCLLLFGAVTRAECQSQIFRDLICRLPEDGNGFGIDEAAAIISGCQVIRRRRDESEIVERNRSEEHTSELQSLMRISYAVFCLKKKKNKKPYV